MVQPLHDLWFYYLSLHSDSRVVAAPVAINLEVIFDNTMRIDKPVDALCRAAHYHPRTVWKVLATT